MQQDEIWRYAKELFGESFVFRDGQIEAIDSIVSNVVFSDVKSTILEAPTGSGKSIIALISSYILFKAFEKKSYILVSDLSLFDQYVKDIDRLGNNCFGYIKGKENYICHANGCKVSQSRCSLQGMSIASLKYYGWKSGFGCVRYCQYAQDYANAVKAPITLMTYQLYFIQRNYVEDCIFNGRNPNFPKRDLVICDECHKICDICQSHFAPRISIERPAWMNILDSYTHNGLTERERQNIIRAIEFSGNNDELLDAVAEYGRYLLHYCNINNIIRMRLANAKNLPKRDKDALFAGNVARQEHCKIDDMLDFVDELKSSEYIVESKDDDGITINFVFDSMMLKKYLHKKSGNELLMSATIGDFNEYAKIAGIDESTYKTISMKSTFDFSDSPIYLSNKNEMGMNEKQRSLPRITRQIASICRSNADLRGIIQTGSYSNSCFLQQHLPEDIIQRCIFYDDAEEKREAIEKYKSMHDGILVGPTLIEGLNFPDDMCRFQICIKVPYAYLGSDYIVKKMKYIDGWYIYDAITKICQGIGRGVRHKNDWCKTYILDGCIMKIYNKLENIEVLNRRFKLFEEEK